MANYLNESEEKKRNAKKILQGNEDSLRLKTLDQLDEERIVPDLTVAQPDATTATATATERVAQPDIDVDTQGPIPADELSDEEVAKRVTPESDTGQAVIQNEVEDLIQNWMPKLAEKGQPLTEDAKSLIPTADDVRAVFDSGQKIAELAEEVDADTAEDFIDKFGKMESTIYVNAVSPLMQNFSVISPPKEVAPGFEDLQDVDEKLRDEWMEVVAENARKTTGMVNPLVLTKEELLERYSKPITGKILSQGINNILDWSETLSPETKRRIISGLMPTADLKYDIQKVSGDSDSIPADFKENMFDSIIDGLRIVEGATEAVEEAITPMNGLIVAGMATSGPAVGFGASAYFLHGMTHNLYHNSMQVMDAYKNGDYATGNKHVGKAIVDLLFMKGIGKHAVKSFKDGKSLYYDPARGMNQFPALDPKVYNMFPKLKQPLYTRILESEVPEFLRANAKYVNKEGTLNAFTDPFSPTIARILENSRRTGKSAKLSDNITAKYINGRLVLSHKGKDSGGSAKQQIMDAGRVSREIESAIPDLFALNQKKLIEKGLTTKKSIYDVNVENRPITEMSKATTSTYGNRNIYKASTGEGFKGMRTGLYADAIQKGSALDVSKGEINALPERFVDFYKKSAYTVKKEGGGIEVPIWYHATPNLKILDGGGNFRARPITSSGNNTPMFFLARDVKMASKFVGYDKFTRLGKDVGGIDVHTVHTNINRPFVPKKHYQQITEPSSTPWEVNRLNVRFKEILKEGWTEKDLKQQIKSGDWNIMERFADILKESGFDAIEIREGGSTNLAVFDPAANVFSTSNFAPGLNFSRKTTKAELTPKETKLTEGVSELYAFTDPIAGIAKGALDKVYKSWVKKELKPAVDNLEVIQNIKAYNEFLETGAKPTKKNFTKYITDIVQPQTPEQVAVVRSMIDSFGEMKKNHKEATKIAEGLDTGAGGMPKPPQNKPAEKYASNMNLETVPKEQVPMYKEIYRAVGATVNDLARGKVTWDATRRRATNPDYLSRQIDKILNTEQIIKKDGSKNPDLRINEADVYGYKLLTSAMIDVYKANPTPQNLANLMKTMNASSAVLAEAGRSLQAAKIKVEANAGVAGIEGMLRELSVADIQPGYMNKLVEWQRNMKLMSPSSLVRSIVGNNVNLMLNVIDMPIASINDAFMVGLSKSVRKDWSDITGKKSTVTDIRTRRVWDFWEFTKGHYNGLNGGLRKAWALLKEDPAAVRKYSKYSRENFQFTTAIGGNWGKLIRTPQRLQGAIDVLIREPAIQGFIYRTANNIAQNEGLVYGSKAWAKRTAEIIKNPSEKILSEVNASAEYITFQSELGPLGKQLNLLRSGQFGEAGQLIVPFFNTPVNIFKQGIHRSPFGLFTKNFFEGAQQGYNTGNWSKFSDNAARVQTGTALTLLTAQGILKTLDGEIEGDWAGLSKGERDFKLAQGRVQNSIRFLQEDGSYKSYSYEGYEPVASVLRFLSGWQRGVEGNDTYSNRVKRNVLDSEGQALLNEKGEIDFFAGVKSAGSSMVVDFLSNPFMQGVQDIQTMIERTIVDGDSSGAYMFAANFVRGTVVPNFISQSRKIFDPIYRDRPTDVIDAFYTQIPGTTGKVLPKVGMFGELIEYPDPEGSIMALRRTENLNINLDAMYNELEQIGVKSIPEENSSWAKGLSKEQEFLAKTIRGEAFAKLMEPNILGEDGKVKESWSKRSIPVRLKMYAQSMMAARAMTKMEFIDNFVFDKTQHMEELMMLFNTKEYNIFKNELNLTDVDIAKQAREAIYASFNEREEIRIPAEKKAKKIKEEKEESFTRRKERIK